VSSEGAEKQRKAIRGAGKGEQSEIQAGGNAPHKGAFARCIMEYRDVLRSV